MDIKFTVDDAGFVMDAAWAVLVDEGLIARETFDDWVVVVGGSRQAPRKWRMAKNMARRLDALMYALDTGRAGLDEPCEPGWKPEQTRRHGTEK